MTDINAVATTDVQNTDSTNPVQHEFLNFVIGQNKHVNVYLLSGIKLEGRVLQQDDSCLILLHDGAMQLIYKNAVSTILPINYGS